MGAQGHPALTPLLLQLFRSRVAVISLFLHSFHQQTAPDPLMFTHQMTHGHTHTAKYTITDADNDRGTAKPLRVIKRV